MRWSHRFVLLLALVLSAALANAQGSAGGYGQGGGGAAGSGAGFTGAEVGPLDKRDATLSRPDEEQAEGVWETKSAILTPGDRVEYKIKMAKGDTLMAGATSDAFDPALSVEDDKGTAFIKNDDRAEGDQSPFVIFRAPADGTYLLKVLSFRSVSGGKFTLKLRKVHALEGTLGAVSYPSKEIPSDETEKGRVLIRLALKKNCIYDLRNPQANVNQRLSSFSPTLVRVIGPTGVEQNDFTSIPVGEGLGLLRALADGDYYLEYRCYGSIRNISSDYRQVAVVSSKAADQQSISLEPGEAKVVEFDVKPDLLVRTTLAGPAFSQFLSAPDNERVRDGNDRDGSRAYGTTKAFSWFQLRTDSDLDVVRVFHGDGMARVVVRSTSRTAEVVSFKNSTQFDSWNNSTPVNNNLDIGESKIYLLSSSKSELMRVKATADHFLPKLEIFRLSGQLANTLIDRQTHVAEDDLYFPDQGVFLVRFSCDGDGGSGGYAMNRNTLEPTAYNLGNAQEIKFDGVNFGLYWVNLEAGKRYELLTDEADGYMRADLLDDDGQFLQSANVLFGSVRARYFVPTKSGRHRLWLRGPAGTRHFNLKLHATPKIGG